MMEAMIKQKSVLLVVFVALILIYGCTQKPEKKPAETPVNIPNANFSDIPPSINKNQILIGVEYASTGMAKIFSELGIPAVKYYPDVISWDKMQPTENATIDFSVTDEYVKEYQEAGFSELVIALKSRNKWASKDFNKNYAPQTKYMATYKKWVQSIVERYDNDGQYDMPGLKFPVRFFEIGTEFSSYEPEPVEDYIFMLESAYRAAHNASDNVIVMHAAFLTTTAFKDNPKPSQYDASFAVVDKRIMLHSLADIRKVLDRPDIFDAANFHSLGDSTEIEANVKWLNYEMQQRGYKKPIVVSDTATSPLIGWGSAITCIGSPMQMGILVQPATENDRCRLADYFKRLVDGDDETVKWTQRFAAADDVKKVVVSASQGILLINMAFMEDLYPLKLKIFMAGAGTAPWSGMVQTTGKLFTKERTVSEYRPAFFALKQLATNIRDYESVERVPTEDSGVRLYKFTNGTAVLYVVWLEPETVVLPGDTVSKRKLSIETKAATVTIEPMVNSSDLQEPKQKVVESNAGHAEIEITPTPIYVFMK